MSHMPGKVRFDDGTIFHCEYNGTSDVMKAALFETVEACRMFWRKEQPGIGITDVPVRQIEIAIAAADYGGGFWWYVKASKQWKVIVDGRVPHRYPWPEERHRGQDLFGRPLSRYGDELIGPEDGLPDWWSNAGVILPATARPGRRLILPGAEHAG